MRSEPTICDVQSFAKHADYSLLENLTPDPYASRDGNDRNPRQVFSGHYVPVAPTALPDPAYVSHSQKFFRELGLCDALATDAAFMRLFSGDLSQTPEPMRRVGWATGYALSIYGTEYYEQCPFGTGNGYGDGRAISIFEGVFGGKRWEFQLKGGGRTPYCRGADGRAVLRSSVREFLAQEHMHALGIPTTRSLTLYVSQSERVKRPWFRPGTYSHDPNVMISEPTAITTRVASSFLRVGQLELFGRRARKNEHPKARNELEQIIRYAIRREYPDDVKKDMPLGDQAITFARCFADRLAKLISEWIRVGYCQGNFNSDNCAVGGFTLDYGPFGFIDEFRSSYQPWTGGGRHFSFFNQPLAGKQNFMMFLEALKALFDDRHMQASIENVGEYFDRVMQERMAAMWCRKFGLPKFNAVLVHRLMRLMEETKADYTIFFRELSHIPESIEPLRKSFYTEPSKDLLKRWEDWFFQWHDAIDASTSQAREALSARMKRTNPKYTLREWILVPAYEAAHRGDYSLIEELKAVMNDPYAEHDESIEAKYYRKKPDELFDIAGVSFVSCSS